MSSIERWRVRKLRHEHPIGIDEAERVAKVMFAWAYPRGLGKYRMTWSDLHSIALDERTTTRTLAVSREYAMKVRTYWRTLAGIALREGTSE